MTVKKYKLLVFWNLILKMIVILLRKQGNSGLTFIAKTNIMKTYKAIYVDAIICLYVFFLKIFGTP